jgi:hypothetical protein
MPDMTDELIAVSTTVTVIVLGLAIAFAVYYFGPWNKDDEELASKYEVADRSLFCLKVSSTFRRALVKLIHKPAFDTAILIVILCNAMSLALDDPLEDKNHPSQMARTLAILELIFNIIFTAEMMLKIGALGFILNKFTYLRSPWNLLDFFIVITGWIPYTGLVSGNSTGMRAFRLLRPLRTINRFPGLRKLVITILLAIPQLGNLCILVLIFFMTFGIVGVQLWNGRFLMRCHTPTVHAECAQTDRNEEQLCVEQMYMFAADASSFCDIDRANSCGSNDYCERHFENPFGGLANFDNIGHASIIVMQIITLSSWQDLMHVTQDTSGTFSFLYFMCAALVGAFFMVNLFVAVIKDKFDIANAVAANGADVFLKIDDDQSGELDAAEMGKIFLQSGKTGHLLHASHFQPTPLVLA